MDVNISTQVLDSSRGRPISGLFVVLEARVGDGWLEYASARTDSDGRIAAWGPSDPDAGLYRMTFHTGAYYGSLGVTTIFPEIGVCVLVGRPGSRLHVPLLISPYAYAAYGEIGH